jgi:hypothetical protein
MKRIIILTLSLLNFGLCYCQINFTIDSLSSEAISQLDAKKSTKFLNLYSLGKKEDIYSRFDTLIYDYAFIQATYCEFDSSFSSTESYFISGDTFPKYHFLNGQPYDMKNKYGDFGFPKYIVDKYILKKLLKQYSKLKKIQTLQYDKVQIWGHSCVIQEGDEKEFIAKREKELKQTYQIQTFIDKKKNKIIISIQSPPKRPKFKTFGYNFGRYLLY